ncbi:MAG: hypothetical protein RL757_3027 [Bacteroidota bacterium]|jgi:SSS family solute:Na+ symporter
MQASDYLVFLLYFAIVSTYGYWVYNRKKSATADSADYFLAEGSLTWWAIGASLIASNISAEQFVGMSGSGFAMGLAIASYEWMAAVTLIVVAVFFLPIYLKNRIFTMPQFLSLRYNESVALVMAVFWLFLYVFVNLTSILHLGALAVSAILGGPDYYMVCAIGLAIFALFITLGGMKVIGYTDVIQVVVLIIGGLATTYLALDKVSNGAGAMAGMKSVYAQAGDHFHMILNKGQMLIPDGKGATKDAYMDLPGLTVLFGAMWIANLNYWGCNQYITQRALGADLKTARSGLLFAAFLKVLMPIIVVIPGIAAYVIWKNGGLQTEMLNVKGYVQADRAYPVLLNLLPTGLKGLSFAALTAAIVASLAGKANSIATIFSLDIYKKVINKNATEKQLIDTGKIVIVAALVLACIVAPQLKSLDQAFQFIQKYTGFVSPGIFAIFALGFFWKGTTSNAALAAAIATLPISIYFDVAHPEMPFLISMGYTFLALVTIMVVVSLAMPKKASVKIAGESAEKVMEIDPEMFKVSNGFAVGALLVLGIVAALYALFW